MDHISILEGSNWKNTKCAPQSASQSALLLLNNVQRVKGRQGCIGDLTTSGQLTVLAQVTADSRWTAAAPIGWIAAGTVLTLRWGGAVFTKPPFRTRCGFKQIIT